MSNSSSKESAIAEFRRWAASRGLQFRSNDTTHVFQLKVGAAAHDAYVIFLESIVILHVFAAIDVPQERRPELLDLLARINTRIAVGSLDIEDENAVVFRVAVLLPSTGLDEQQLDASVAWASLGLKLFQPLLSALASGVVSSDQARERLDLIVRSDQSVEHQT